MTRTLHLRPKRAFTLIELLVVVAVITVLIAMLLPSLGRARDQARTTACCANLRSLALELNIYATENDQCIPFATDGNPLVNIPAWHTVFDGLIFSAGKITGNDPRASYNLGMSPKVLRCPASGIGNLYWNGTQWGYFTGSNYPTNGLWAYGTDYALNSDMCNPLIMRNDQWQAQPGLYLTFASLKRISQPQNVMAFMDGTDRWLGGWAPGNGTVYRHNGNTATTLSFLDGHAEVWKVTSCQSAPPQGLWNMTGYNGLPWH